MTMMTPLILRTEKCLPYHKQFSSASIIYPEQSHLGLGIHLVVMAVFECKSVPQGPSIIMQHSYFMYLTGQMLIIRKDDA